MASGVRIEVIRDTQKILGKHVKKPQLTEKLLQKPPFRFLHDVIKAIVKETGFLAGLYDDGELVSDNVKEKDDKIAFLNKLIDAVKSVTKAKLGVRASKVVAGLEPTETNLLLQAIGRALDKKLDGSEYVSKLKAGAAKKSKKSKKTPPVDSKPTEVRPEREVIEPPLVSEVVVADPEVPPPVEDKVETPLAEEAAPIPRPKSAKPKSAKRPSLSVRNDSTPKETDTVLLSPSEQESIAETIRPRSSLRPPSVRPSSARPGAPRLKADTSLPIDKVVPLGKVNVIIENYDSQEGQAEEDDEETVQIQEVHPEAEPPAPQPLLDIESMENRGQLVDQILEQMAGAAEQEGVQHTSIERDMYSNRETTAKEIEQLRASIQLLTRTANPYGKLINYLHEDVDAMQSEHEMWTKATRQTVAEIREQKKIADESHGPLQAQLAEIEQSIERYQRQISAMHGAVFANNARIRDLLIK